MDLEQVEEIIIIQAYILDVYFIYIYIYIFNNLIKKINFLFVLIK
jgi:hypothetical protein